MNKYTPSDTSQKHKYLSNFTLQNFWQQYAILKKGATAAPTEFPAADPQLLRSLRQYSGPIPSQSPTIILPQPTSQHLSVFV
jgi:hypothetical protein